MGRWKEKSGGKGGGEGPALVYRYVQPGVEIAFWVLQSCRAPPATEVVHLGTAKGCGVSKGHPEQS